MMIIPKGDDIFKLVLSCIAEDETNWLTIHSGVEEPQRINGRSVFYYAESAEAREGYGPCKVVQERRRARKDWDRQTMLKMGKV